MLGAILSSARPLDIPANDELVRVNGELGFIANKEEHDNWYGDVPVHEYPINDDPEPEVIRKKLDQLLIYDQEVAIRYLRPITPPPPGDIILKEDKNIPTPPAPPIVVRQQPARPQTPPPIVIREAPPQNPSIIAPKIVTIPGKKLPPPPRKVVVERLPALPKKPPAVIIERWLPYSESKRRVIFKKNTIPDPVIPQPKNVIIQWEPPKVQIKKSFKDLGVIRANPQEYINRYADVIKPSQELPQFVKDIKPNKGVLAADFKPSDVPELIGDINALNLIDLDKEGLSEYKNAFIKKPDSPHKVEIIPEPPNPVIKLETKPESPKPVIKLEIKPEPPKPVIKLETKPEPAPIKPSEAKQEPKAEPSKPASKPKSKMDPFQERNYDLLFVFGLLAHVFSQADTDSDGKISREEAAKLLNQFYKPLAAQTTDEQVDHFVDDFDTNHDGYIDFDEFKRGAIKKFINNASVLIQ